MSAFIVDKKHIDALVTAALRGEPHYSGDFTWYAGEELHRLNHTNADEVGAMLLAENVRSVSYRYADSPLDELPGRCDNEWMEPYAYRRYPLALLTDVQVLKAVRCYEYQTCEHPQWEHSSAYAFCEALIRLAISRLPGYEEAAWEITA